MTNFQAVIQPRQYLIYILQNLIYSFENMQIACRQLWISLVSLKNGLYRSTFCFGPYIRVCPSFKYIPDISLISYTYFFFNFFNFCYFQLLLCRKRAPKLDYIYKRYQNFSTLITKISTNFVIFILHPISDPHYNFQLSGSRTNIPRRYNLFGSSNLKCTQHIVFQLKHNLQMIRFLNKTVFSGIS